MMKKKPAAVLVLMLTVFTLAACASSAAPSSNSASSAAVTARSEESRKEEVPEEEDEKEDVTESAMSGSTNPEDYWVSENEYDLASYFRAYGADVSIVKHSLDSITIQGVFQNDWEIWVNSADDRYSGEIYVYATSTNGDRKSDVYGFNLLSNDTILIKLSGTDYFIDYDILYKVFPLPSLTEERFSGILLDLF